MKKVQRKQLIAILILLLVSLACIIISAVKVSREDPYLRLKNNLEKDNGLEYTNSYIVFRTSEGDKRVEVEVADSADKRTLGLMFRERLEDGSGILFIFDTEVDHPFWMKNTLIPLDMIFIGGSDQVVALIENATPCEKDPCTRYFPGEKYDRVVEVNSGWVGENGVEVGDPVVITQAP
ncbi:DUF192 domain-containing protein [Candidatus Nomurabacteria bacterium]|nr:DUF192 domain-containing protein [Candidatus Nomurabacteria bacterium]